VSSDDGQLELIELRRRFCDTVALDGLTFTVPRGQVLASSGQMAQLAAVPAAITLASTVWMARLAGTIDGRAILRAGGRLTVRQVLRSDA